MIRTYFWGANGDNVPTATFSEFLNKIFTKYCLNIYFWYAEWFKINIWLCIIKNRKIPFNLQIYYNVKP